MLQEYQRILIEKLYIQSCLKLLCALILVAYEMYHFFRCAVFLSFKVAAAFLAQPQQTKPVGRKFASVSFTSRHRLHCLVGEVNTLSMLVLFVVDKL